jgi:reductive dehalogenase
MNSREITTEEIYELDVDKYKRFHEKNNMIYRRLWDKKLPTYQKMFYTNIKSHIKSGKPGYTRFDFALVKAGWTVYEKFPFAFSWKGEKELKGDYGIDWTYPKGKIKNLEHFTRKVKHAARLFGASLVGIANVNEKWIYKTGYIRPDMKSEQESKEKIRSGQKDVEFDINASINLPEGINKVIVMAIEMDRSAISTAPAQPAAAATSIAYSKMAFLIACMGELIRNLGYRAIQCGNDTALSIPLAIDAGLGALGRNGLLISPQYGSRVRICKVFTDLPLKNDYPDINFIKKVNEFCVSCHRCAKACEVEAISLKKPTKWNNSISNNSGVKKYYVNVEKCFEFWIENSSDCGKCISVCPFSKIQNYLEPEEFWKK